MNVTEGVDKVAWLQATHLCHHHGKECIGGDVEWHTEEHIGTTLVELARQFAVGHIKLEEGVAGRECSLACRHIGSEVFLMLVGEHTRIPCRDDMTTAVWILLDAFHHLRNLVNAFVVPVAPLGTVNGTEVTVRVGPFIPN